MNSNKVFVLNSCFTDVAEAAAATVRKKNHTQTHMPRVKKIDALSILFIYIATELSSSIQLKRIKCYLMFYPDFVRFPSHSHFNGAKLFLFFLPLITYMDACVGKIALEKKKYGQHLNYIDDSLWQTSSDQIRSQRLRKSQSCYCLFVEYLSSSSSKVEIRKSIVHARLTTNPPKKVRSGKECGVCGKSWKGNMCAAVIALRLQIHWLIFRLISYYLN